MCHCRIEAGVTSVDSVYEELTGGGTPPTMTTPATTTLFTASPSTVVRADSRLTAHAAGRVLDASVLLSARTRALMPALTISPFAYGALASVIAEEHMNAADDLENTVERITAEMQADADKLYQLAFAFAAAEQQAADQTGAMGGT
jgi:hypothetical protein